MVYTRIAGTGQYLPKETCTNEDWENILKAAYPNDPSKWTTNEWILERSGIETRRVAGPDETNWSMGGQSLEAALEDAKTDAGELGMIICCTNTPEKNHVVPPSASHIHARVKAPVSCAIMDLYAGCTAFTTGLAVADGLIRAGIYKTIALVGTDKMTQMIKGKKRETCVLFGDLACSWILKAGDSPGIVPIPGSGLYCNSEQRYLITQDDQFDVEMAGRAVFKAAAEVIPDTILSALEKTGYKISDVKAIFPHNANGRMIDACIKKMAKNTNMPEEDMRNKFYHRTREYGNTSAPSSANCIHEARKKGFIREGDLIVKADMGAGFTWGVSIIRL